jgi:hypothetical protein
VEALQAEAGLVAAGEGPAVLLGGLGVVERAGDADVEHVGADGARHGPEVVERGVVLEPEHLEDDGEQQRPLRAEAEADRHRRRVQRRARKISEANPEVTRPA